MNPVLSALENQRVQLLIRLDELGFGTVDERALLLNPEFISVRGRLKAIELKIDSMKMRT